MQSNNPSESKKMRDARILLEILMEREREFQKTGGIPIKQAFAELREEANRKKILYADLFNNNHASSKERYR